MSHEDPRPSTLTQALEALEARALRRAAQGRAWDMELDSEVEEEEGAAPGQAQSEELLSVLRFHPMTHHYALPGEQVLEVIGPAKLTPLPGSPPYILGITVHRRQVVGVLDLDRFFYPDRELPPTQPERVILVEYGSALVGLHAGQRAHLEQWPVSSLSKDSVELLLPNIRPYARALRDSPQDPDVVLLLNLDKVLEDAALRG